VNKRVIGAILFICIMTINIIPATGNEINPTNPENKLELFREIKEIADENETLWDYVVITIGPVAKTISQGELLDGPESQMMKIRSILNRTLLRIFPALPVAVFGLNFTVYYKRDIGLLGSRLSYETLYAETVYDENGTFINLTNVTFLNNKIHKIKVVNFTGVFIFYRARVWKGLFRRDTHLFFIPARFAFVGVCDNVIDVPLPEKR
jgi:hypothetical protein